MSEAPLTADPEEQMAPSKNRTVHTISRVASRPPLAVLLVAAVITSLMAPVPASAMPDLFYNQVVGNSHPNYLVRSGDSIYFSVLGPVDLVALAGQVVANDLEKIRFVFDRDDGS